MSSSGTAPTSGSPLSHPLFRDYYLGRTVSVLGSAMTPTALAFAVLQLTDDPHYLGYVLSAAMLPMLALMLVGGGVADRIRQDRLLLVTNLGSGVAMGAQALVVLTHRPVGCLIPLAFVNGVIQAFSGPAMQGIVPKLVPRDKDVLQKANSLLATSRNASRILGPSVAGVLVATVGGGWGMAADALSFFVSAAFLARLSLPEPVTAPGSTLLRDLRDGWRYFRTTSWMWPVSLAFALINVIQLGVWQILGPVLALGSIGPRNWGLVLSARAAGTLVMSALMFRIRVRRPLLAGLPALTLCAAPLILLGLGADTPELVAVTFVAGMANDFYGVLEDTTRHTYIPPELMSRVTTFDDFGSWLAIPVGQLAAVPLASLLGARHVALGGGAAYVVIALAPLAVAAVRRLGTEPPPWAAETVEVTESAAATEPAAQGSAATEPAAESSAATEPAAQGSAATEPAAT